MDEDSDGWNRGSGDEEEEQVVCVNTYVVDTLFVYEGQVIGSFEPAPLLSSESRTITSLSRYVGSITTLSGLNVVCQRSVFRAFEKKGP